MPTVQVVRTYFEMTSPGQLRAAGSSHPGLRVDRVADCPPSFFRYLYSAVGAAYHWVDRLPWTDDQVREYLGRPEVSLSVLHVAGAPAGYYELMRHPDGSTEIAYFGLLPEFHGRGLGGHLLTLAVREAWAAGTRRVWLHTCTLDHPAAVPNYRARGFTPYKEEVYEVDVG